MKVLGVGRGLSGQWKKIESSLQGKNKRSKNRKGKLSADWKDIQKAEKKGMKLLHRSVRNVEKELTGYLEKRQNSSEKKKDGALKDYWKNASKSLQKTAEKQARILRKGLPVDALTKSGGKFLRKLAVPPRFPF